MQKTGKIIAGLGNPGEKYALTRHNTGRIILDLYFKKFKIQNSKFKINEWEYDKKLNSLKAEMEVGKNKVLFVMPETFMNNSGKALGPLISSTKKARGLIVIHDDLDLPLGKFKIVFNRGSAGHKGVESIIRGLKTKEFTRIRVGISQKTPSGKIKKPDEKKILDFLISDFKPQEIKILKKISQKIFEAIDLLAAGKLETAMNQFN